MCENTILVHENWFSYMVGIFVIGDGVSIREICPNARVSMQSVCACVCVCACVFLYVCV